MVGIRDFFDRTDKLMPHFIGNLNADWSEIMSRLTTLLFSRVRAPNSVEENFQVLRNLKLGVSWVIEAGCHDGSDTEKMLTLEGINKIYAFEPDTAARNIAKSRLARFSSRQLSISPYALMDYQGIFGIDFQGLPGSGSTQVRRSNQSNDHEIVQAIALDDFEIEELSNGFLWLDVEGVAHEVLAGGIQTLQKISARNLEVEFYDMSESRRTSFKKITRTLRSQGFGIWASDIHPGYFGNIFAVRSKLLPPHKRIIMEARYLRLLLLYSFVYPALNKPEKRHA